MFISSIHNTICPVRNSEVAAGATQLPPESELRRCTVPLPALNRDLSPERSMFESAAQKPSLAGAAGKPTSVDLDERPFAL
jgi:hypothetical protein